MKFGLMVLAFVLSAATSAAEVDKAMRNYKRFISNLTPGKVFELRKTGEEYDIEANYVSGNHVYSPKTQRVDRLEREIILKVEKDKIYRYLESTDYVSSENSYRRIIVSKSFYDFIPKMLSLSTVKFTEGKAILRIEDDGYTQTNDAIIEMTSDIDIEIDTTNFCEIKGRENFKDAMYAYKLERKHLAPISSVQIATCGDELTLEELKKINLSSIQVCTESDEVDEEEDLCKDSMDMSKLLL